MTLPKNEYPSYAQPYVDTAIKTDKNILDNLQYSLNLLFETLGNLPKEKQNFAYAKDKWTIKELVQHLIDSERIFAYRALRVSRNDTENLLGFDENDYAKHANTNDIEFIDLLKEFSLVRKSNIAMFAGFSNEMLLKIGMASNESISVRGLGILMSGHVLHHLKIIEERYF